MAEMCSQHVFKPKLVTKTHEAFRAVELCSRQHLCCVLSVRECSSTKRTVTRKLL